MFKTVLAIFVVLYAAEAIRGKCRALVLGGGSDRIIFQAGAIAGLISALPSEEVTWDVIVGTGVGAVNAIKIAQTPIGEESSIIEPSYNFWMGFHRSMIYKSWFGGKLVGYYKKTGFYNNAPLETTINKLFDGSFDRFLSVGVTDLVSGNYYVANVTVGNELMIAAIEASLNDNGYFPITEYKGHQLVSGELIFPIDLPTAVNACVQLGYTMNNIIVDSIVVTHAELKTFDPVNKNTVELVDRYLKIVKYHNLYERMQNSVSDFPFVNFRSTTLLSKQAEIFTLEPFGYDRHQKVREYNLGYEAAVASVTAAQKE